MYAYCIWLVIEFIFVLAKWESRLLTPLWVLLIKDAKDADTLANLIVANLHLGKPTARFLKCVWSRNVFLRCCSVNRSGVVHLKHALACHGTIGIDQMRKGKATVKRGYRIWWKLSWCYAASWYLDNDALHQHLGLCLHNHVMWDACALSLQPTEDGRSYTHYAEAHWAAGRSVWPRSTSI